MLEGLSFLVLLGVAMPLKYLYGMPGPTSTVGMIHGVLFVVYVGLAWGVADEEGWPRRQVLWAFAASVLPLGTFMFDRAFLKHPPPPA